VAVTAINAVAAMTWLMTYLVTSVAVIFSDGGNVVAGVSADV